MRLLTCSNPKTAKGVEKGYLTAVLHLAPADSAGVGNVCVWATEGCVFGCLNTAGRGGIFKAGESTNAIQEARKRRTRELFADRRAFLSELGRDVDKLARLAAQHGLTPALRLNGTSDLSWERLAPELLERARAQGARVYDYTKSTRRALEAAAGRWGDYHLTLSRSEKTTDAELRDAIAQGVSVAVVFERTLGWGERVAIARNLWGAEVIDGDADDLRFRDPSGVIVSLTAKGRARRDTTGFVVRLTDARVMSALVA